ncbi:MAG TPA: hypothetical protein VKJ01_09075 [Candidatus Solibacter sp.]|nr:hypothetical protein [Candidatus Solibacter sp.]
MFLGAGVGCGVLSHQTPGGQPPLTEVDAQSLENLKDRFNQAASEFRVVLLLSPT